MIVFVKRIFTTTIVSLMALSGCVFVDNSDIEQLDITRKSLEGDLQLVESLEIVPDYAERTLDIDYKLEDENAVSYAGTVGGEFFDRYEAIVKEYKKGEFDDFEVENSDETKVALLFEMKDLAIEDGTSLHDVQSFMDDLLSILLTEAPV